MSEFVQCDFCGEMGATSLWLHVRWRSELSRGGLYGDYCSQECLAGKVAALRITPRQRDRVSRP